MLKKYVKFIKNKKICQIYKKKKYVIYINMISMTAYPRRIVFQK